MSTPAPSVAEPSALPELKLSVETKPRVGDESLVGLIAQGRYLSQGRLDARDPVAAVEAVGRSVAQGIDDGDWPARAVVDQAEDAQLGTGDLIEVTRAVDRDARDPPCAILDTGEEAGDRVVAERCEAEYRIGDRADALARVVGDGPRGAGEVLDRDELRSKPAAGWKGVLERRPVGLGLGEGPAARREQRVDGGRCGRQEAGAVCVGE